MAGICPKNVAKMSVFLKHSSPIKWRISGQASPIKRPINGQGPAASRCRECKAKKEPGQGIGRAATLCSPRKAAPGAAYTPWGAKSACPSIQGPSLAPYACECVIRKWVSKKTASKHAMGIAY